MDSPLMRPRSTLRWVQILTLRIFLRLIRPSLTRISWLKCMLSENWEIDFCLMIIQPTYMIPLILILSLKTKICNKKIKSSKLSYNLETILMNVKSSYMSLFRKSLLMNKSSSWGAESIILEESRLTLLQRLLTVILAQTITKVINHQV